MRGQNLGFVKISQEIALKKLKNAPLKRKKWGGIVNLVKIHTFLGLVQANLKNLRNIRNILRLHTSVFRDI